MFEIIKLINIMEIDSLTIFNVGKSTLNHLLQFWEGNNRQVNPEGNFSFIIEGVTYHFSYKYLEENIYNIQNYDITFSKVSIEL